MAWTIGDLSQNKNKNIRTLKLNKNVHAQVLCYISYGMNGYGMPQTKLLGRVLESASEIVFLLLILLLAKEIHMASID